MVLISKKVDYAILVLNWLMERKTGGSAREIAAVYGLSRPFIANILKQLCHEGFVESQRGVHGGYRLARSPSDITLRDVIGALDGPFQLMSCADHEMGELDGLPSCGIIDVCPVRSPLRMVHERLMAVLGDVTLQDLQRPAREPALVSLPLEIMNG